MEEIRVSAPKARTKAKKNAPKARTKANKNAPEARTKSNKGADQNKEERPKRSTEEEYVKTISGLGCGDSFFNVALPSFVVSYSSLCLLAS